MASAGRNAPDANPDPTRRTILGPPDPPALAYVGGVHRLVRGSPFDPARCRSSPKLLRPSGAAGTSRARGTGVQQRDQATSTFATAVVPIGQPAPLSHEPFRPTSPSSTRKAPTTADATANTSGPEATALSRRSPRYALASPGRRE